MRRTELIFVLAAILASASCSIKENRVDCPCWLHEKMDVGDSVHSVTSVLNFYGFYTDGDKVQYGEPVIFVNPVDVNHHYDGVLDLGEAELRERISKDGHFTYLVKKGIMDVCCQKGLGNGCVDGRLLYYQGSYHDKSASSYEWDFEEADSLYSHHSYKVDCLGDDADDSLKLHKQYTRMTLYFQSKEEQKSKPLGIQPVIKADGYAINMTNLTEVLQGEFEPMFPDRTESPYSSAFCYVPPYDTTSTYAYTFNLPRQGQVSGKADKRYNIRLELYYQDKYTAPFDTTGFIFGKDISDWFIELEKQKKFSWEDEDLLDIKDTIKIQLDTAKFIVNVKVGGKVIWEEIIL